MAKQEPNVEVLAGSAGVNIGESRTNHEGRRAILLVRGNEDTSEFCNLVKTMGIVIVDEIIQPGKADPNGYFGKGRLQDVADELGLTTNGHHWYGIDLLLLHTNATPRQLVAVSDIMKIEVWDRVRLLLSLFTSHANSLEARTQVRIARLQSDRTVLRELANQTTSGERAGYGGGGVTALQSIIANVNRELTSLRKRQKKHANAQAERRRQRSKSGVVTIGIAGYTNAGKSSFFLKMSGKEVLVEDKLFSTLETTIGRFVASPRILLADTIGFIDNLPTATLDAFRATLAEALECDMLLLLIDATDNITEFERKLSATRREVNSRMLNHQKEFDALNQRKIICVLTKVEHMSQSELLARSQMVMSYGYESPLHISVHHALGFEELQRVILQKLFGKPTKLVVKNATSGRDIEGYVADIYDNSLVINKTITKLGNVELETWISKPSLAKLLSKSFGRIEVK